MSRDPRWRPPFLPTLLVGFAIGAGLAMGAILTVQLANRLKRAAATPPSSPPATTAPAAAPPTSATPSPTPAAPQPTAPSPPPQPASYPVTPIPYPCDGLDERIRQIGPVTVDDETLAKTGLTVLCAIRDQRWDVVASYAHPDRGDLRFSPDVYLSPEDLSFPADLVPGLPGDDTVYTWGTQPGSGMPIRMTFRDYVRAYVYDGPYWDQGQPGLDVRRGVGNIEDNHATFYPHSRVVEFYLPPSEPGGLDWRSLRLIFLPLSPHERYAWRLVAITHDAWTP